MQELPPSPRRFNDEEGERTAAPAVARLKAEIAGHPLFEQLLSTHVACLRVATPVDQLPRLDAQLARSNEVLSNYSGVSAAAAAAEDDASYRARELHQFMMAVWKAGEGFANGSQRSITLIQQKRFAHTQVDTIIVDKFKLSNAAKDVLDCCPLDVGHMRAFVVFFFVVDTYPSRIADQFFILLKEIIRPARCWDAIKLGLSLICSKASSIWASIRRSFSAGVHGTQGLQLVPLHTILISILARGYEGWINGEANILITRGLVGRLSNTPNVGFAYEVQNVVDYLASHGVRALPGRRYDTRELMGQNWIIVPSTVTVPLQPTAVITNNLIDGRISLHFNNYQAARIPTPPRYNSRDNEESDEEQMYMVAVLTLDEEEEEEEEVFYIKKITSTAKTPRRASKGVAGYDLAIDQDYIIPPQGQELLSTGISIKTPVDTYARIAPRSSYATKGIIIGSGVLDSDYRDQGQTQFDGVPTPSGPYDLLQQYEELACYTGRTSIYNKEEHDKRSHMANIEWTAIKHILSSIRELELICQLKKSNFRKRSHFQGQDTYWQKALPAVNEAREQLQHHVRVHAMDAVIACWELEQNLQVLTGASPGEGTGATMSGDEEDQTDGDINGSDESSDGLDDMGLGYQILEFQGYKEKLADIREEILRKRRAGRLPGGTTCLLKAWWQSHSKWPYPTEEDKVTLVRQTGLQLKQINNWFINQRKRNWQNNTSSSASLKNKCRRYTKDA
ncbi:hypothetical protein ZIOFF_024751 [Zingiber officinale]|uniref:Homeobox domain-containing protein n=1 Tax=Zingiber officinale TaxID=94328 RepID=A0A8J5LJ79_ZINOF|nr:hypothetical protein ZIOFF_024751 [Zingiber officinale]